MKKFAIKVLLISLFISPLIFSIIVQATPIWAEEIAQMKATVVKVSGDVRIRSRGSLFSHDAKANEILKAGDRIETKENGKIEIKLDNNNVIDLKPKTKLILRKLTANLKTGDYENLFESNSGSIRAKVEKLKGNSKFEVKTPNAVACVRGTIMYLVVYPDSTISFFQEGVGFITNPFSGQTFDVAPGNVYQIDENGNVTGPVVPTPEQLQDIIEGWDVDAGAEGYSEPGGGENLGDGSDHQGDANQEAQDDRRNSQETEHTGYQGLTSNSTSETSSTTTTTVETDTDGDGIPDSTDTDDDGDGMTDVYEIDNDLNPLVNDAALDKDEDGLTNLEEFNLGTFANDNDSDNDGYTDKDESDNETDALSDEEYPDDNDEDYVSDLNDPDDDNDGYLDVADAFPFDSNEWLDTDGDLVGNNADLDDDGDGYSDADENDNGTDPLLASSKPSDNDNDFVSDLNDPDDDNDGYTDVAETTAGSDPMLAADTPLDTDGDGTRNYVDNDDDNDGLLDVQEITLGTDPLDADTDNDGLVDGAEVNTWNTDPLVADADADNDHIPDIEDAFSASANLNSTNPNVYGSRDSIRGEIKEIIVRNALRTDIQDMINDAEIRHLDAAMAEVADAQTGKVLTDRQGYRVRIDQYVLRPDSYTVQLLNINLRTQEAGSLAGLNTLDWTTRFSQPLDSLTGQQLRDLPWNEYLLGDPVKYGTTQPSYYPDWTQVRLDNSQGNTFMEKKDFASLQYSSSNKWHQDILWDKVSFNSGSTWYSFSTSNISGGSTNPDGFSIDPSGLGSSYNVDIRFYVISDSGTPVNSGSKAFDSIWEALAVNMPRASNESTDQANDRNIGNNNLEISLSSKFGGSTTRDIDLIYIPWSRQNWNTGHHW